MLELMKPPGMLRPGLTPSLHISKAIDGSMQTAARPGQVYG
jgi:hypothetical protein